MSTFVHKGVWVEDEIRSLSEVAGLMGVSERTVRRWIKSGRLKAYKPGRDYRIPETALRRFIEESEISPKVQAPLSSEPSFNHLFEEERREDEELAAALMEKLADDGEQLEEGLKASYDSIPLQELYAFSLRCLPLEVAYRTLAREGGISNELREAMARLDEVNTRIGTQWNELVHPDSREAYMTRKLFAEKRAGERHAGESEQKATSVEDAG
jgi:excisionase family DNA binding protein